MSDMNVNVAVPDTDEIDIETMLASGMNADGVLQELLRRQAAREAPTAPSSTPMASTALMAPAYVPVPAVIEVPVPAGPAVSMIPMSAEYSAL